MLESVDPLAERVRMIGQDPPAHPMEAMKLASVVRAQPHATMRQMAEEADRNQLLVIKEMRQAVKVRGVASASVTHDRDGIARVSTRAFGTPSER